MLALYRYCHHLKAPLSCKREGLLLELDGGWGEIAPLPGFSKETLEECEAEIKRLTPTIRTAQSKIPSVQWGLACAKLPWPPEPMTLPLSALTWNSTIPPGYKTIKLKLKNLPIQEAIRTVKKIQELGPYEIRLDCNRSWDLTQALEFTKAFHPTDFAYLEEPLSNFKDLKEFSHRTGFPIAVDESLSNPSWLEIPTLKAAVIKPMILGAIPDIPPHIDPILSGSYETGIGTLQIARAWFHLTKKRAIGLDTYRYLEKDLLKHPLKIESGHLIWDGDFKIDRNRIAFCA